MFYEAPHRLTDTLKELLKSAGNRDAACVREITKKYEEVKKDSLENLLAFYGENPPKGEFVVIVGGADAEKLRQEEIEGISRRFKSRLERFEKDAPSMDETTRLQERRALAEMERDVTRRSREAREEFNQRRNEEVLLLQNRAGRLVQDLAKREKFDLVLYEYFYASDRIDLTKRVIDLLDASSDARKK